MLVPLELPPGAFTHGTQYQTRGRFHDVNRVRGYGKAIGPIGGWRLKTTEDINGKARAILTWKDNDGASWAAIGTHSKLYAMTRNGTVTDQTPSGFTAGSADSVVAGGYGMGPYGAGLYGTPRPDDDDIQEASVWTLDTRGEDLIGCMVGSSVIYHWPPNTADNADPLTNAPLADAVFVTAEGSVVALADKTVTWSDGDDPTLWTPDATNTAGDFGLQTSGALKCGKRIKGGNLVFTDVDAWTMTPTRDVFVYGFERAGTACGVISRQCVAALDDRAVWMSQDGFFIFNGAVSPLQCEVFDRVFEDINLNQAAKVTCVRVSEHNEVWWFYPSGGSTENDRYVSWNHLTGEWYFGRLARTCGADRGVFAYPLMVDPETPAQVWEHEVGYNYDDDIMPHAEAGPLELGQGDGVMHVRGLYPDEAVTGDVSVTIKTRFSPNAGEVSHGPYTLAPKTDFRVTARQVSVRYEGARLAPWRVGAFRMDVTPGGLR